MRRNFPSRPGSKAIPALTAALIAAGVLTNVQAQIQSAGKLFVNVDATVLPLGAVASVPNTGTLGGVFAPLVSPADAPVVATIGGTKALSFDGTDLLQHVAAAGGSVITTPAEITGENRTCSIEVWALNPAAAGEETLVSWGKRGGPDGSNMSFNYGSDFRWGAVGHWANRDLGWNSQGGNPAVNKWHHLVYTYDGATTRVFSDGVLQNGEFLGDGAINTHPDTAILIGSQTEGDGVTPTAGLRFSGAIARVRIHDGVLTPAQVASNYITEKAAFIDPPTPPANPIVTGERLTKPPVHRYSFSEAAGDATDKAIRDSVGTAHGKVVGEGATFNGSRLVLPGGSSGIAAYGDLPNGLLSANGLAKGGTGGFSFETWIKITGNQNWSRIFDFGSSGTVPTEEVVEPGGGGEGRDYLIYSASIGTDVGNRRLELRNEEPAGGGIVTRDVPTATFNTDMHVAVTWQESTGLISLFENGGQIGSVTTDDKMSDINDINVWLGRSNWTADSNTQGEYDEVRFYDYALTPGQALGSFGTGPDALNNQDLAVTLLSQTANLSVSETANATLSVTPRGSSPIAVQWFRNGKTIEGATSLSYLLRNTSGADNGAIFTVQVSNTVNGAPVTVTSAPIKLTVVSAAITLKNRYSFNETSGTTVTDSVGGKNGTLVGAGIFAGGELKLDGVDSYVDLPNGVISGLGTDGTIELWFTHESATIWSRIFDFGASNAGEGAQGGGVDFLFLTPRTGDGFPRFTANFPTGAEISLVPAPPFWFPANEQRHVVVSWAASGNTSRLYVDGVLSATGTAAQALSTLPDVNNWLGRSQFIADGYWGGKINELRLYTGGMTPSQAAASFAAGPSSLPVELPSLAVQISGNNLVISWPASATGFALESSSVLGAGAAWTAVSGATASGASMQVSVPRNVGTRFFRLKKP